jgi:hypothetical protein
MSAMPDVKVKNGFGPAVTVTIVALLGILLVVGGTIWWLGKISTR